MFALENGANVSLLADIDLFRQGESVAFSRLSATPGDASMEAALPTGNYTPELVAFTFFDDGVAIPAADVTFIAFDPDPITISARATTNVTLSFEIADQTVELVPGESGLVVNSGGCVPACGAEQVCANVNAAGPACHDTCNAADPCPPAASCLVPADADAGLCLANPT